MTCLRIVALTLSCSMILLAACSKGSDDEGGGEEIRNACNVIGVNPRIINGEECGPASSSAVVRIGVVTGDGNIALCTGTMLTSTHVLTAGHCVVNDPVSLFVDAQGVRVSVRGFEVHPGYATAPDPGLGIIAQANDVAVLTLSNALSLPTVGLLVSNDVEAGDNISIAGYGVDDERNVGVLRAGNVRIDKVSTDHLLTIYDSGDESNSCNGDSGGPALRDINGTAAIVGVVSTGTTERCEIGDQSVFINIQSPDVLNFIVDQVPGVKTL